MNGWSLALVVLAGCGSTPIVAKGTQWEAADAIFHADPRWLGADAAYSIDLGGDRTAWLFGDTLVARTSANVRAESVMVRNTIAVQTGLDPTNAKIEFSWKTATDGTPASYFPENGTAWHWPGHGVRVPSGPLIVFLNVVTKTSDGMLGFVYSGWRIALIDNPDKPPGEWSVRTVDGPKLATIDAVPGAAAVRDHGFVVALAPQFSGAHDAYLVRFAESAIAAGTIAPEWWTGSEWKADGKPAVVIPSAGTECSLHFEPAISKWVHVTSRGFGATTISIRIADALEGPWSDAMDAYTPPESKSAKPFVYAAKAHPELQGGGLVVTYATNSFDFATLFAPEGAALYWPRFVRISFAKP